MLATTDLSDAFEHDSEAGLQYLAPGYHDYGGRAMFHGPALTLVTDNDNTKLRATVETKGKGRVLVVDGQGSMSCALLGGNLAKCAADNGWAGIIIHGCVRDAVEIKAEKLGVKALATHPKKSQKNDGGRYDAELSFSGVVINSGDWVYADEDGVIVSKKQLSL